jgi:hypothetical protein
LSEPNHLPKLTGRIADLRTRLADHPMYDRLRTRRDIARFMEYHVFAVWDFMCLLKGLQRQLTCVDLPWMPVGAPQIRRMVNELVLEEESDEIDGVATGHFELYLKAMQDVGADTTAIRRLLELLGAGVELPSALALSGAPEAAREFVQGTFDTLNTGKAHIIAAAFTWGREQATGPMFSHIVASVGEAPRMRVFTTYLQRHIQLDGDNHAQMTEDMVVSLCGSSDLLWHEAAVAAEQALRARLALWSAIADEVGGSEKAGTLPPDAALAAD